MHKSMGNAIEETRTQLSSGVPATAPESSAALPSTDATRATANESIPEGSGETSKVATPTTAKSEASKKTAEEIVPVHDWIYHLMYGLYSVYFRIGGWEIHDRSNVPLQGPIIVAPNHVSSLDPPLIGSAMPREVTTMAKHELFEKKILGFKILGFIIRHMGAFPVRRGVPDRTAIRRAIQVLKDNGALVVFPEGTRTPDGNLGVAELGMAMIAHTTKTPILPVYIKGTDRCFSRLNPGFRLVKAEVFYGKPLSFEEEFSRRGDRATLQAMTDKVMAEIARMRDESIKR